MTDYPWNAEARIQATPEPDRTYPEIPPYGTLATLVRIVMERLSEQERAHVQIEYGNGNPSLDAKAIEAAYHLPTFPR